MDDTGASDLLPFRCLRALDEIRSLLLHARTDAVDLVDMIHRAADDALYGQPNPSRQDTSPSSKDETI
jgi:hypothetical protein